MAARKKKVEQLLSPRLFKALGDPTRIGILSWLADVREACTVSQVADTCSVGVSVVSRHLATLRDAGLLQSERRGKEVYYRVCADVSESLRGLADILEGCVGGDKKRE